MTFAQEKLSAIRQEAMPLLRQHWEEIALNRDTVPLDPRWDAYQRLEDTGVLHITTARDRGLLVGLVQREVCRAGQVSVPREMIEKYPGAYCVGSHGDCLNPAIADGDVMFVSPSAPLVVGGFVLLTGLDGMYGKTPGNTAVARLDPEPADIGRRTAPRHRRPDGQSTAAVPISDGPAALGPCDRWRVAAGTSVKHRPSPQRA